MKENRSSERNPRLDLSRGLANWAIFLDHLPNNAVAWVTTKNYGFGDAADLFVFVSGVVAMTAVAQYRAWIKGVGFSTSARLWRTV